ncbi:hypothetical protein [Anabaena subtropica]|uniref:Uncharacterized protein n=1 Tax=Anabaena subtropica FACHB-260 TaxID=2692884 RepID=A0ABR8CMY6_9NOST|nr:hypothetical protein [Anabaena subtropica]MBD2344596.1 hypothetical protein [Anabaena subtropica FACHB-260]
MKIKKIACALTLATTLIAGITFKANAEQPLGVITRKSEVAPEGVAREIKGTFQLENVTKYPLIIEFSPVRTESYLFNVGERRIILKPGESKEIAYTGGIFQDGKWQINFQLRLLSEQGILAGRHTVDIYFLVEEGKYQASTYEKLFLVPDVRDSVLGDSFSVNQDDGSIPRAPLGDIRYPAMKDLLNMQRESILKIPTDSSGKTERPTINITNPTIRRPNIRQPILSPTPILKSLASNKTLLASGTVQAKGVFSWKGMDNLLHPAFGWRVRAWRLQGGNWVKVGEDWIESNGSWNLSFPQQAGKVKFQYVAFNRFFTPQTSLGNTYRWVGPERSSVSLTHNEGGWIADTSGGAVRGLGEVYREGMNLWSKLYWDGGINPLRKESIKVIFPNTAYDCGNGSGVPWSCANTGGNIWLIPSHASRNGVMQHELAHQINYEYWDNKRPAGSGGSHTLGDCYTPGLAMMEGFANFMVFWTQAVRGASPDGGFDFAVENPAFACQNPINRNESWTAATFWDFHDTRADGQDNLWFNHPGAVPGIYLRAGMKSSMADFATIYRNGANAEHRTIIDNIARQNFIIP